MNILIILIDHPVLYFGTNFVLHVAYCCCCCCCNKSLCPFFSGSANLRPPTLASLKHTGVGLIRTGLRRENARVPDCARGAFVVVVLLQLPPAKSLAAARVHR